MASRVDHEQRRRELTDALGRITLKGGLAGVSYREVANEAGVSVATVQYYFGTKDELLLAAWEHLASRVTRRIFAALADAGTAPSPQATIATALEAFLPLDAERTDAATLFIAFHTASLTDPLLARAEARAMPRDLVTFIADELGRARRERFLASWVDPEIGRAHV